jgi:regulator of RNase E activity RraA
MGISLANRDDSLRAWIETGMAGALQMTMTAGIAGCLGTIVDGAVRDIRQVRAMGCPVFAKLTIPYDKYGSPALDRPRFAVEIGGARLRSGAVSWSVMMALS